MEEVHVFTVQKLYGLIGGLMAKDLGTIEVPLMQDGRQQYLALPEAVMEEMEHYLPPRDPAAVRRLSPPQEKGMDDTNAGLHELRGLMDELKALMEELRGYLPPRGLSAQEPPPPVGAAPVTMAELSDGPEVTSPFSQQTPPPPAPEHVPEKASEKVPEKGTEKSQEKDDEGGKPSSRSKK